MHESKRFRSLLGPPPNPPSDPCAKPKPPGAYVWQGTVVRPKLSCAPQPMSALTAPHRRPNPLNGFLPYEGEFSLLNFDYVAVRAHARAALAPTASGALKCGGVSGDRVVRAVRHRLGCIRHRAHVRLWPRQGCAVAAQPARHPHCKRSPTVRQCAIRRGQLTDAPPGPRAGVARSVLTALRLPPCARFFGCALRSLTSGLRAGRSELGDRIRLLLRVVGSGLFIVGGILGETPRCG